MSRRFRLILIAIAIIAVALVVFFLVLNPMRGEISDLRTDIEQEDTLIAAAERELAINLQAQKECRANQARLIELSKMMPSDSEVPSLIIQIQDLADKAGIDWIQVSPGQPSGTEDVEYQTLALSLSFSGNFYDVSDFIYRAEQMVAGPGRLMTVKSLSLSPEGGSGAKSPVLKVDMTLLAFEMPATQAASE